MSVSRTVRERVYEEVSGEILATARIHLARDGAAGLSLRSVARDLDMVPSALYRYYPGRDALLSALILTGYESLATAVEQAEQAGRSGNLLDRWMAVVRAVRAWALATPHEWGLLFGTPVSDYDAPEDTLVPYRRIADALMRPVLDARAADAAPGPSGGEETPAPSGPPLDDAVAAAVAPVADALGPGFAQLAVPLLTAWSTIVGTVSLEVFGHWRNTVMDPGVLLEVQLRRLGTDLGIT